MDIGNTVKLTDGRRGKVFTTPSGFMANGSYEVEIDGKMEWLKEDDILYVINTEYEDDINKYFEIIFDENGLNLVPKGLTKITIDDETDEYKTMEFSIINSKHEKIVLHLGNTPIWDHKNPEPKEVEEKETKKHRIL